MHVLQKLVKKSVILGLAFVTVSGSLKATNDLSLSGLKIDIFRKEINQPDLMTLKLSKSHQGKQVMCQLSNKITKTLWVDEKVLDKIEESTVIEALKKGFKDESATCEFSELKSYLDQFEGIISCLNKNQIIFYDIARP